MNLNNQDNWKYPRDNYFYETFGKVRKSRHFVPSILTLAFAGLIFYAFFINAPGDFPKGKVVSIPKGAGLSVISNLLEKEKVIRSPFFFRQLVRIWGGEKSVMAGDYLFEQRIGAIRVTFRLVRGDRGFEPVKIVIPEGFTSIQIAKILEMGLEKFDAKKFVKLAKSKEGYLFPDTYVFQPDVTPEQAVEVMVDNFSKKVEKIRDEIEKFGKPLDDIITMASIIEAEARTKESRRIIAGILWKRLSINMPLQVDAAFRYINGKTSKDLTLSDLQEDNPYNTYTNKGLTPTPINNPGLNAILDTVTPIETKYFFYLTDNNGVMRYAANHDGHLANREKYLGK